MKTLVARASRTTATFALAFAAVAAWPGEARAQQTAAVDEGRNRFNRGIDLYKEGNFHGALAEFRAAYAAAPSYRIQYNLGQTLFQIQDYAGAVRAFEQYLADGGDKIEPDRRKDLESDIAKLRPRVARLSIVVNAPNADVVIDEEPRGKALKQGVLVSAGRRRFRLSDRDSRSRHRGRAAHGAQVRAQAHRHCRGAAPQRATCVQRAADRHGGQESRALLRRSGHDGRARRRRGRDGSRHVEEPR
jgi:tetratricopeptide (TPR) repeat protein